MTRRRLVDELIRRGLAPSTEAALGVIGEGRVTVDGRPATRAETLVSPQEAVNVLEPRSPYASRGGEKLAGAMDRLGVEVTGTRCLDAGASSGGFTDVLLSRGATSVIAVDVGYGQLAWHLRNDARVVLLERTNVRDLRAEDLPFRPGLVTADLSFMSLAGVVPVLVGLAEPEADLVLLVKPQFEAPRPDVGSGGVVSDPDVWRRAVASVADACNDAGAGAIAVVASRLRGPAGNVEFFLHARVGAVASEVDASGAIEEAQDMLAGRPR